MSDYLDSVREIERRVQKLEENARSLGDLPGAPLGPPEDFGELLDIQFEMIALSWQTNRTRVATLKMVEEASMRTYPNLDVHEAFHPTSHWGGFPDRIANLRKIQNYHTAVFAKFVKRLQRDARGQRQRARSVDHPVRQQHGEQRRPQQRSAAAGADRPWRRRQGQPAPALPAGHAAREHPGDDAASRGRAGAGHREVRRQHRRLLGSVIDESSRSILGRRGRGVCWRRCSLTADGRVARARTRQARQAANRGADAAKEDVNRRNADGSTPLQWAVYNGDVAEVKRLLRAGANVSLANNYGATPMSLAAEVGNTEMLKVLLEAGADVESPNADGQTALLAVARTGNVEAARAAAGRGAKVDAREKWGGQTPLMWASARRHPAMMQLLDLQGRRRQRPLHRSQLPASYAGRGASQEPGQRGTDAAALCRARELHGVRRGAAREQGGHRPAGSRRRVAAARGDHERQLGPREAADRGRRRRQPVGHLRRDAAVHGDRPAQPDRRRPRLHRSAEQDHRPGDRQAAPRARRQSEHAVVLQAGERARHDQYARRHAAHPRGQQRRCSRSSSCCWSMAPTPPSPRRTGRRRSMP